MYEIEQREVSIGFIPLTDCAPLIIAKELGFFAEHGLDVHLQREPSWSAIRDKLAYGLIDAGQMLAGIPIACTLGHGGVHVPMITALSLDLNGNAITVSRTLWEQMTAPGDPIKRPVSAALLRPIIERRRRAGLPKLRFATVYPVSSHHYELRYWLAAGGIDPDEDVQLRIVPPPQVVNHMETGRIDGFCVGEPWNQVAVHRGLGHAVITNYEIWNNSPEKVLAVRKQWAEQHPGTHQALLRALLSAARWLDQPTNREEVARIIAQPRYIDAPPHVVRQSITGLFHADRNAPLIELPDFNVFFRYAATFPWRSHAVWFITQMMRWGQIDRDTPVRQLAEAVYRPDLYREAADATGTAAPTIDYKIEGEHDQRWVLRDATRPILMGPDRFLDGRRFDPDHPLDYVRSFDIRVTRARLESMDTSRA